MDSLALFHDLESNDPNPYMVEYNGAVFRTSTGSDANMLMGILRRHKEDMLLVDTLKELKLENTIEFIQFVLEFHGQEAIRIEAQLQIGIFENAVEQLKLLRG